MLKNKYSTQITILLFIVALFAKATEAKVRTYSEIIKSNELRICYYDWLGSNTDPKLPSPDLEIAQDFAKNLNLKAVVNKIEWKDIFIVSPERMKKYS